ncbi:MAG: hypothetical protein OER86_12510 [Phycisphaerae bacterium]|nr:hypothetical protein [Phycisphaerae bacterium]
MTIRINRFHIGVASLILVLGLMQLISHASGPDSNRRTERMQVSCENCGQSHSISADLFRQRIAAMRNPDFTQAPTITCTSCDREHTQHTLQYCRECDEVYLSGRGRGRTYEAVTYERSDLCPVCERDS